MSETGFIGFIRRDTHVVLENTYHVVYSYDYDSSSFEFDCAFGGEHDDIPLYFVSLHRNYGGLRKDKWDRKRSFDNFEEGKTFDETLKKFAKAYECYVHPVSAHIHGGITVYNGYLRRDWDNGIFGFFYSDKDDLKSEYSKYAPSQKIAYDFHAACKKAVEYYNYLSNSCFYEARIMKNDEVVECYSFYDNMKELEDVVEKHIKFLKGEVK
jgi:hypothetical protein